MVSYAQTNALSMLGGDDLSDITDSIAILDASVVHKTGNLAESIDGDKTFVSDVTITNNNLIIQTTGTNSNTAVDGILALSATDPSSTGLLGQIIASADTNILLAMSGIATSLISISPTSINNETDDFTVYDTSIINHLAITPTLTTLTNNNQTITSTGINKLTSSSVTTSANTLEATGAGGGNTLSAIGNPSYNILEVSGTSSYNLLDAIGTNSYNQLDAFGTNSYNQLLSNTITNYNEMRSLAGFNRLYSTGLISAGVNANVLDAAGVGGSRNLLRTSTAGGETVIQHNLVQKMLVTDTATTNTNATITNVATTAFKVQSVAGTDKFSITPTLTQFSGNPITLSVTGALNGTVSTFINIASQTSSAYSATTSLALTAGTLAQLTATTTNTISSSGAVSDAIQIDASSASGGIKMRINAVEKIFINSGVTEITNASVDIVGNCYAPSYSIGTHTSSVPLCNYSFNGFKLMGTVQATNIIMTPDNGAWNGSFTIDRFRSALAFTPYAYELSMDNGTAITGTATSCSITVTLLNGSSIQFATATTTGVPLNNASQQYYNGTFSSVTPQVVGTQILLRFQYTANGTVTANVKGLSCKVWGYQY